jgi:hypothetical protein
MQLREQTTTGRNIEDIATMLLEDHRCHTAILYGSHARGDPAPGSDYDVAGFADVQAIRRVTGPWRDSYLDIFIHPQSTLDKPTEEMLYLRDGVVLFQQRGCGDGLLRQLDEIYARGPAALSDSEKQARRNWAWKMLDRVSREDVEGNFRRAWLLTALLEDYFHLRGEWYEGPKRSLSYLAGAEPRIYAEFEAALLPGARLTAIAAVVEAVAGPRLSGCDV